MICAEMDTPTTSQNGSCAENMQKCGSDESKLSLNPFLSFCEEVGEQENDDEKENDELDDEESDGSNENSSDGVDLQHSDDHGCDQSTVDDSFLHMLDSQPVLGGFTAIRADSPPLPTSLSQLQAIA